MWKKVDHLCGLMVRVPGYRTEMYCDSSDVRTEFLYVMLCYVMLWHYQKKKVVDLERGPLSLVSTIEELLGRKSSGSGLESPEYGPRDS
jgi:hypothetical protein